MKISIGFLKQFFTKEKFFFIIVPHNQSSTFKIQFSISNLLITPALLLFLFINIYGIFLSCKIQYSKYLIANKNKTIEYYQNQTESYLTLFKNYSIYLADPLQELVNQFDSLIDPSQNKSIGGREVSFKPEQQSEFIHNIIKEKSEKWQKSATNLNNKLQVVESDYQSIKNSMGKLLTTSKNIENRDTFLKDIPSLLPVSLKEVHSISENKNIYSFNLANRKEKIISPAAGEIASIEEETIANKKTFNLIIEHAYGMKTIYKNIDRLSSNIKESYLLKKGEVFATDTDSFTYKIQIGSKFINLTNFVYY